MGSHSLDKDLRGKGIREFAEHLSASGWAFDEGGFAWRRGANAISVEALDDALRFHTWAKPQIKKALAEGAIGFKIEVIEVTEVGTKHDVSINLKFEWPASRPLSRL